ncbi:MAG: hypothetical protein IJT36_07875 [Alphaproteobacteria bacterium]|nr:hypothetical protein [Alphaproteobacteria bacterium]
MTVELRTSEAKTIYMLKEIAIGDTFNIPFKYLDFDENIKVAIRTQADDDSNDSFKELTLDTDYYIMSSDGTNGIWGVVTFLTAYSGLQSLVIYRDIPVSQDKTFNSQTKFSTTTEAALDKLTMIAQDNVFENRILRAPIDDTVSDSGLELPIGEEGYFYTNESGEIEIRSLEAAQKSLRQPDSETEDESFVISAEERAGNILAFNAETAKVDFIPIYSAGTNIQISDQNVISATDTTYTAGDNVDITNNVISATDTTYTAGDNVDITNNVISATDTTYTAGDNVDITNNVISATDTTYTAGDNVDITNNVISATDTTYTAGANVDITNNVISATDTTYTAGANVDITNNVISATDTTYTAGDNVQISDQNVISATDTTYTAGTNVTITNGVISATDTTYTAGTNVTITNGVISASYSTYTAGENITIENDVISADVAGAKVADLTNWTQKDITSTLVQDHYILYGDGVFVGRVSGITWYWNGDSSSSWTSIGTSSIPMNINMAYGNGRFIAISNSYDSLERMEYFYTSSWQKGDSSWSYLNTDYHAAMAALSYGVYNNQTGFVALSNRGSSSTITPYTRYSLGFLADNSNRWSFSTPQNLPIAAYSHLVYGDGKFVAISDTTVKVYDGSSWSTGPSLSSAPSSVCYGAGKFIAVCDSTIAIWSGDLNDSWDTDTTAPITNPSQIKYGNGRFVLLSSNTNSIAYSANGTSWLTTTLLNETTWSDICYGNGKFVAIGIRGLSAYTATKTLMEILLS